MASFPHGQDPCKPCRAARQRAWRIAHRELAREQKQRSKAKRPDYDKEHYRAIRQAKPEYCIWKGMNTRCHNPKSPKYPIYGARGIAVCDEWRGPGGFERFISHIGPRPSPDHSIDRIDNDRGYEPGNVRWATRAEQSRNRRTVRKMASLPEAECLADAAGLSGLPESTLRQRLGRGWTEKKALSQPVRPLERMITVGDVTRSALEWSRALGGSTSLVSRRIHDGWDPVDAASAPLGFTKTRWEAQRRRVS